MPESSLLAHHRDAGARLMSEAGWEMPADFGDTHAEHRLCRDEAILIDLSHRGKLRFHGPDAVDFLHGMLSNQVKELKPGEGTYNAFLTRQGKFVSDLYLYRREEDLLASLAPGMAAVFAEEIEKYIIMDQVEAEDVTESLCCLGLFGPRAAEILEATGAGSGGLAEHGHRHVGSMHIAREYWTGEDGFLLTAPSAEAQSAWERIARAGAAPAGLAAFMSLTLESGTPLFGTDLTPEFNPMQAGLEQKAIDFEKGCYIGQEVIAKIKYLGQVNRGLCGLRLEGGDVPPGGTRVCLEGKEIGTITRAAYSPSVDKILAFAYLPRAAMEPGVSVEIQNGGTSSALVSELPFYRSASLKT